LTKGVVDYIIRLWRLNRIAMEALELKTKIHDLIDLIDDYGVLEDFYRVLNDYHERKASHDILDDLAKDQKMRLNESIHQSDIGKTIPHKTMKAEIKEWLTPDKSIY
jgi:hypothetical protein